MSRSHRERAISTLRSLLSPSITIISARGAPARIASRVAAMAPSSLSIGTITESFKSGQARIDVRGEVVNRSRVTDVHLATAHIEAAFLVEPNSERINAVLL